MNNTPIVVLLLPILVSVCLRTNNSPSKILMPMGFATLVGGMATTIGTSTNLLVVSVASDLGLAEFGMFDFVYPAAIAGAVAFVYLWLIAPRLLPARDIQLAGAAPRLFEARLRLTARIPRRRQEPGRCHQTVRRQVARRAHPPRRSAPHAAAEPPL